MKDDEKVKNMRRDIHFLWNKLSKVRSRTIIKESKWNNDLKHDIKIYISILKMKIKCLKYILNF